MNAKYFPSLLLVTTIVITLLLEPFTQYLMPNGSFILVANRMPFNTIPASEADDEIEHLRNVIIADQLSDKDDAFNNLRNLMYELYLYIHSDKSTCSSGSYAEDVRLRLKYWISKQGTPREYVSWLCPPSLSQTGDIPLFIPPGE